MQQTAQRVGIALVVALLWQLTSCSRSPAANDPAVPRTPTHTAGHGVAVADPASTATGTASGLAPSPSSGAPSRGPGAGPYGANGWNATGKCAAPPVIAHRGEGASTSPVPENTSAAELAAAHEGASLLNADVRWTSDDVPVVVHDPTLDRTTTGSGPVQSITARQFAALSLRTNNSGRVLAGRHPETLAQLLATAKRTGLPIVLQMEADPFAGGGAGQASIDSLAAVISASGYGNQIVVGGWAADDVRAFSSTAPTVRTAYIQESGNPTAASILATGAHILYIDYAKLTAAQVSAWHAGGLAVWAWTPAFAAQWTQLRAIGVDAIATNWVGDYTHWARPCAARLPSV